MALGRSDEANGSTLTTSQLPIDKWHDVKRSNSRRCASTVSAVSSESLFTI